MRDNIPDALITAFERQYDSSWNDPQLRNERLAMRYGWAAAMEAKQCLHQIQEPAPVQTAPQIKLSAAVRGVGVVDDCDTALAIYFTAVPRKEDIRALHDALTKAPSPQAAPAAVAVPDEREAFEAWARWACYEIARADGNAQYESNITEQVWQCWKARAALAATPAAAPTDEPVFLQRLRVEQQELDARQQKLGAFIESSEFRLLSETDAALLSKQEALQHVLLQTLNQRIHSASEKHMREKRNA